MRENVEMLIRKGNKKRYVWQAVILIEIVVCAAVAVLLCMRTPYVHTVSGDEIINCDYMPNARYINNESDALLSVTVDSFDFSDPVFTDKCQKIAFMDLSLQFGVYCVRVTSEGSCSQQLELIPYAKKNIEWFKASSVGLNKNETQQGYILKLPAVDLESYGYDFYLTSAKGETAILEIVVEEWTAWKLIAAGVLLLLFMLLDAIVYVVKHRQILKRIVPFLTNNRVLPIVYMIVGYLFTLLFVIFKYESILDSDMASELMLGNHLAMNGGILDGGWYYSTELRVLNTQLIYKLFFVLLGDQWHLVRVCSVAVFLLILLAMTWYFLWNVGMKRNMIFWIAGTLIWPFANLYALIVLYGAYYIPHITINFGIIALTLHFCRMKDKRNWHCWSVILALFLLSFAGALGGVRQMMLSVVPLVITGGCLYLFGDCPERKEETGQFLFANSIMLVAALIGYSINHIYFQKVYSYVKQSGNTWEKVSIVDMLERLSDFFRMVGYQENVPIISVQGVINFLLIFLVISFVVSLIRLMLKLNSISFSKAAVTIYTGVAIVLHAIIFAATGDVQVTHWIPLIPFVFIILGIAYETETGIQMEVKRKVFLKGSFILFIILSSVFVWMTPRQLFVNGDTYYENPQMYKVVQWLESREYTQGMATFWGSNVLTEFTDGRMEMWVIELDPLKVRKWLQVKEHVDNLPEEKVFLLLTQYESKNSPTAKEIMNRYADKLVYADDNYFIYEWDDIASSGLFD